MNERKKLVWKIFWKQKWKETDVFRISLAIFGGAAAIVSWMIYSLSETPGEEFLMSIWIPIILSIVFILPWIILMIVWSIKSFIRWIKGNWKWANEKADEKIEELKKKKRR